MSSKNTLKNTYHGSSRSIRYDQTHGMYFREQSPYAVVECFSPTTNTTAKPEQFCPNFAVAIVVGENSDDG
jgi:hypothetical protein